MHFRRRTGRSQGGTAGGDAWPPEDARDEWWLDETRATACERLVAARRTGLRQVVRWLFVNGGISVVFLFGLMAFGVIGACFDTW